jgi:nucleoside-diphosphate-sugar epimerase
MKALLIGGTGFIGRHLARMLIEHGHEVLVFHRGGSDLPRGAVELLGDRHLLADFAHQLRGINPDVVIDLVLSSGAQARNLMTVFRGAAGRVVALSSCDVYRACGVLHGIEPGPLEPLPLVETSALRSHMQAYPPERLQAMQQVFGWLDDDYDKISVEREVLSGSDLPGTVLRLPMIYGPGDPLHRLFPIVKRMDDRRPAILFEEKHAAWRAPRGYVENVAAAVALAATDDRSAQRTYNVADPEVLSELEWAQEIAAVTGWRGEFTAIAAERTPAHLRMPGNLDQHWVVDSTRIREELGYREPVSRHEAIRRTVEWERANPPTIDPGQFDYPSEDIVLQHPR